MNQFTNQDSISIHLSNLAQEKFLHDLKRGLEMAMPVKEIDFIDSELPPYLEEQLIGILAQDNLDVGYSGNPIAVHDKTSAIDEGSNPSIQTFTPFEDAEID
jgi:hypothetical protein